jgi:hypothetical protein
MPISFGELQDAFLFVSFGAPGDNEAYLDRPLGKLHYHSAYGDNGVELPDDIDDEKYVAIPHKNELGLGTRLVFAFVREFFPDDYDEVRRIFSRRGAYGRYKPCWSGGRRSIVGTIFQTRPKKLLCGSGAQKTRSS